jgi:integrase/recombinase XerD
MSTPLRLQLRTYDSGSVVAPYIKIYKEHLEAARFKPKYRRRYVASVIHSGQWLDAEGFTPDGINEAAVGRFLSEHLPRCACPRPVPLELNGNRAALNHLVRVLRSLGVVAHPVDDELARELVRFDGKMAEVWGLSKGTRDCRCRIIPDASSLSGIRSAAAAGSAAGSSIGARGG